MPEAATAASFEGPTGRQIIVRFLGRALLVLLCATAAVYALDFLLLHYRLARHQSPFGTVTVRPYYAVPQKDHRTEFLFGDPQDQTCVNSLFPHAGDSPCWYLRRNTNMRIDM